MFGSANRLGRSGVGLVDNILVTVSRVFRLDRRISSYFLGGGRNCNYLCANVNTYIDFGPGHGEVHERRIPAVDVLVELAGAVGFQPGNLGAMQKTGFNVIYVSQL